MRPSSVVSSTTWKRSGVISLAAEILAWPAVHSFFRYVALQEPSLGSLAQRVLAIPNKRYKIKSVDFLSQSEIDALLAAPDQTTWAGRRDRTWLLVAVQTGLR